MKNKRERVLTVCLDGSHQFSVEIRETEHFIARSQTGFYDELTVKLFCKFLNLLPVPSHERNAYKESCFVPHCNVVKGEIKELDFFKD